MEKWWLKIKKGDTLRCKEIIDENWKRIEEVKKGLTGFTPNRTFKVKSIDDYTTYTIIWPMKEEGRNDYGLYAETVVNPFEKDNYNIF